MYLTSKNEASDITQQVFLKVLEQIHSFKIDTEIKFWLRKIAIHTCIDANRKVKTEKKNQFYLPEILYTSNQETENSDQAEWVKKLIKELKSPKYELVLLFYYENFSHKEIADVLNISEAYSRVLLSEIKKEIKNKIQKKNKLAYG